MSGTIGVTELQRHFRSVFDQVTRENIPFVLTRGSRPEAAFTPYEEFLRFRALQEHDVLARFGRLVSRLAEQSAAVSEEEAAAHVVAARADLNH